MGKRLCDERIIVGLGEESKRGRVRDHFARGFFGKRVSRFVSRDTGMGFYVSEEDLKICPEGIEGVDCLLDCFRENGCGVDGLKGGLAIRVNDKGSGQVGM